MSDLMDNLYRSLSERWRPEDVAKTILAGRPAEYKGRDRARLTDAARFGYVPSSMSSRFAQADGLDRQLVVARDLFPDVAAPTNPNNPDHVEAYLDRLDEALGIGGNKAGHDFLADRRNRRGRAVKSLPWKSHRSYNKRFRLLSRMRDKFAKWGHNRVMRDLAQIAKSRLATRITQEMFAQDVNTGCFIAYLTASFNRRSTFTVGKQKRAFDTVAEMLFRKLNPKTANWFAIALVWPDAEVTMSLSDQDKGTLLGMWYDVMLTAVRFLDKQVQVENVNLRSLAVHRGNDSSTWNEAAGAFNKARDGWISTLYALGMDTLLDEFAPTKALRLMAADVVKWHMAEKASQAGLGWGWGRKIDWNNLPDGVLEPDTLVWCDLPKPWEVMLHGATCTRPQILASCKKHGIKGGKGWIAPRERAVEDFSLTPELVHGVVVSCPELAKTLRKCGYFSGPSKGVKAQGPDIVKEQVGDLMVASKA